MRAVNRLSLVVCAILCASQFTGCASTESAAASTLSISEVEQIGSRAEVALANNDVAAAGAGYVRIVTAYPNNALAWYRLGTIYLRTGQHNPAQHAFEEALRADPNLSKAYANLAIAHLGQFRVAAERAVGSEQVAEANRLTLGALLEDVNHALPPAVAPAPNAPAAALQ